MRKKLTDEQIAEAEKRRRERFDALNPPDTLGQLRDIVTFRCAPEPWMIIGAVGFASMVAFWTIISPGWKDYVRYSTGRSWVHHGRALFEGAVKEESTFFQKSKAFLFASLEWLDAIAFYMLVGEAVAEGLMQATSMIFKVAGCEPELHEHGLYSNKNNAFLFNADRWQPCCAFYPTFNIKGEPSSPIGGIFVPGKAGFHVGYCFRWVNNAGVARPCSIRIRDTRTNAIVHQNDWNPEEDDGHGTVLGHFGPYFTDDEGVNYVLEARPVTLLPDIGIFPAEGSRMAIEWSMHQE